MLDELEKLAADIAAVARLAEQAQDAEATHLVLQTVRHLEWVLQSLLERPGMLVGEMP